MMASDAALTLDFVTLDVFTSTRFLGNPLAVVVVPAAARARLTQEVKQRIAREFNLSETVFLHVPADDAAATREVDIFTIEEELPFAGHPTIGTAYLVLHHLRWNHVDTLLTKAGPIGITPVLPQGNRNGNPGVRATVPHAVHIHARTLGDVLGSPSSVAEAKAAIGTGLSADADLRAAELAAPAVSIVKGMTFLLVRLPSLDHLARVTANRMDFARISAELLDEGPWRGGFVSRYYYVLTDEEREVAVRTRMVELGFEDPATGSAACTLASYLTLTEKDEGRRKGMSFAVTQGVEIGRQSDIAVDTVSQTNTPGSGSGEVEIQEVHLGGTAVVVMSGSISL